MMMIIPDGAGIGGPHTLLSAGTLDLLAHADAHEAVQGLELLHGLGGVVDEGEAAGLAATELGAQAEALHLVLAGLVHAAQLVAELVLGDVGAAGVEDVTVTITMSANTIFSPDDVVAVIFPVSLRVCAMCGRPSIDWSVIPPSKHIFIASTGRSPRQQPIFLLHGNTMPFSVVRGRPQSMHQGDNHTAQARRENRGQKHTRQRPHSHHHLLAAQQRVADELARPERHGAVAVRHDCRFFHLCRTVVDCW